VNDGDFDDRQRYENVGIRTTVIIVIKKRWGSLKEKVGPRENEKSKRERY